MNLRAKPAVTASARSAELGGREALEHALLGLLPILLTAWVVYRMYRDGIEAVDFRQSFWIAGWRTLHGLSPYNWTRDQISAGVSFPYPAPVALLLAPFGLLSSFSGSVLITAAGVVAGPLALWILEIRDWRLYGATALWAPVVVAWQTGNFTLPLVVGTALAWRFREREWPAAALVACLVSIKPIMAPLWLWLVLGRRWRAATLAAVIGIVLNAASWTAVGWHELSGWLSLLSLQGSLRDSTGYSLIALAAHLGVGQTVGEALMVVIGCLLVAVAAMSARAKQELGVFSAVVLLTLVISPQADIHYFAILLVPLAIVLPRFSWSWLSPVALWVCPATKAHTWQIVIWWALVAVVASQILLPRRAREHRDLRIATTVS